MKIKPTDLVCIRRPYVGYKYIYIYTHGCGLRPVALATGQKPCPTHTYPYVILPSYPPHCQVDTPESQKNINSSLPTQNLRGYNRMERSSSEPKRTVSSLLPWKPSNLDSFKPFFYAEIHVLVFQEKLPVPSSLTSFL